MDMEIGRKAVLEHFGYKEIANSEKNMALNIGNWTRETMFERILKIPEFLHLKGAEKKKFRIVLDYDPEFPRALFQYQEEPEG